MLKGLVKVLRGNPIFADDADTGRKLAVLMITIIICVLHEVLDATLVLQHLCCT
jgi:hypothetical protein